uniref:Uncharacterized protein n=1 Tax=Plectus sambesii TaxID=2011161 RepID=A0A914X7B2_9BILA
MKVTGIILLLCVASTFAIRKQSVAVKGVLFCGDTPASGVSVKLWDDDDGPDPDDVMAQGRTDAQGQFTLSGDASELTNIDPVLKIYHDCDDGVKPGSRKIKFKIPSSYITSGVTAKKTFDIGKINLEIEFEGEERELLARRFRRVPQKGKAKNKGRKQPNNQNSFFW